MIQTIRSNERYHFETDWLKTYWHFSFDHYHDPSNMNFGPLRVFNDDVIAPAGGFPLHGHREMEIVTYIIEGALEHHDDMGNTGVIRPGEIQRMSAGTGVRHSEYNHSKKEPVHLVQLWIMPAVQHLEPSWEQKSFSLADRSGKLLPIAVPAGENGLHRANLRGARCRFIRMRRSTRRFSRPASPLRTARRRPPRVHLRHRRQFETQWRNPRAGRSGSRFQRARIATFCRARIGCNRGGFPTPRPAVSPHTISTASF